MKGQKEKSESKVHILCLPELGCDVGANPFLSSKAVHQIRQLLAH
jgi:hypothetical protein